MQGMGVLLQKKAQMPKNENYFVVFEDDEDEESEEDSHQGELDYVKSRTWRAGFFVFLVGSVLCFIAVGSIGPSLLVVISSNSLLVSLIFSPGILKETRRVLDWISAVLIIVGIALAVTGIQLVKKKEPTIEDTVASLQTKRAVSTWTSLLGLFAGLFVLCRLKGENPNMYIRALFSVRAGISGVIGVMLATPTSALIQSPTTRYPVLWIIASAMIVQVVLDIHIQNRSLKFNGKNAWPLLIFCHCLTVNTDMMFHGPVTFVVWQMGTLVCGSLIYGETDGFTETQWALGGAGCGCVALGVGLSATRPFPGTPGYVTVSVL